MGAALVRALTAEPLRDLGAHFAIGGRVFGKKFI